jgi:hypothetical protein
LAEAHKVINRPGTKIERIVFAPINLSGQTVPARAAWGLQKAAGPGPVLRVRRGEDAITRSHHVAWADLAPILSGFTNRSNRRCRVADRSSLSTYSGRGPHTFVNCFTYAERGLSYQTPWATGIGGRRMDAILNFLARATERNLDNETVQTTIISCGIGSLLLLLFLTQP